MTAPAPAETSSAVTYALSAAAVAKGAQMAVRTALMRDVLRLWPLLDPRRLSATFPGWSAAMTQLVTRYHGQSAQAAGVFYRGARAAALRSPTPVELVKTAPPPSAEWMERAFGFSGPGMLSKDTAAPNTALSTTLGTATRIALDGGRQTMIDTTRHDPAAIGWFRVTDGDPCPFCALLASRVAYKGRGHLYRSERTASFQAHNDCGCIAAPLFSHDQPLPDVNERAADLYGSAAAGKYGAEALTAFRAAWGGRDTTAT